MNCIWERLKSQLFDVTMFTVVCFPNSDSNLNHIASLDASFLISEATSSTDLGIAAMGSSSSVRSRQFLENSVNWGPIIKKYRNLKIETPEDEHKST